MPKTIDTIVPKTSANRPATPTAAAPAPVPAVMAPPAPPPAATAQTVPSSDSYESLFPEPTVTISTPPTWIWWVLLIIAAIGLGLLGYYVANGKVNQWLTVPQGASTPSVAVVASPKATATATVTQTASAVPLSTSSPVASPSPVATATVRVLNGTTKAGAASVAGSALQKAGYKVTGTGNASSQNYASTTVYYATGQIATAQAVQKVLSGYTSTVKEDATIVGSNDIVVVLGPSS